MFIAPAVILAGFAVWLFGDTEQLLRTIDTSLLRMARAGLAWVTALLS